MALLQSLPLPLGSEIIDFHLMGADGETYSVNSFTNKKILVIIFMCNHCPYVKAIINRLMALQSDYDDDGVQVIGINSNDADEYPEDSFENMKKWVEEKGINFVYLRDETQDVAKDYQAQCTPDIYVFDQKRALAYHGRLDDNWKEPNQVTRAELREALDDLLAGRPVSHDQKPSMGCSIKWKD